MNGMIVPFFPDDAVNMKYVVDGALKSGFFSGKEVRFKSNTVLYPTVVSDNTE